MDDAEKKQVTWCHIHIPKTGGTSLREMLLDNFGDGYFSAFSLLEHQKLRLKETKEIIASHWPWLRCYSDHRLSLELPFDTDLVDLKAIAFVREPIDQIVSQFHFQQSKSSRMKVSYDESLSHFVDSQYRKERRWAYHLQIRRLMGLTQNKNIAAISELIAEEKLILLPLDQFELACVVLERLYPAEFHNLHFAKTNVGPKKSDETPEKCKDLIRELAAPDFRLYSLAKKFLSDAASEVFQNELEQSSALSAFHERQENLASVQ